MLDCKSITNTSRDCLRCGRECYSTHCGGLVQTSSTIALVTAITHTSTLEVPQFDITMRYGRTNLPGTGGWDWAATWCWSGIGQLQYL
ncbi:hypothetical protein Bca4012_084130 [Brassica carinata]